MNKENHHPLPITIHLPIYLHLSPQPLKSQNELSQHPRSRCSTQSNRLPTPPASHLHS